MHIERRFSASWLNLGEFSLNASKEMIIRVAIIIFLSHLREFYSNIHAYSLFIAVLGLMTKCVIDIACTFL